jgi:hypothetical protein
MMVERGWRRESTDKVTQIFARLQGEKRMIRAIPVWILIISSSWFVPVVAVLATKAGVELLCLQQECARTYEDGAGASGLLKVLVVLPDQRDVVAIPLAKVPDYLKATSGAGLLLHDGKGTTSNGVDYSVKPISSNSQSISLSYVDTASVKFLYRVNGAAVTPVYSKIMSIGYMFVCLPIALVLAFLVRRAGLKKRHQYVS